MKISKLQRIVPALMGTCALGLTASPALAKQEGKTKVKSSEKTATKENSGRQAGELPSGLQRKKDENGQSTRGLEEGGKKSPSKGKKTSK